MHTECGYMPTQAGLVKTATKEIMAECCTFDNFVISSGCDIPPASPWDNIDAFFAGVKEFYEGK